jgi:hypothetical protein
MKSLHARAAAALLLSIGLAACGGKASFQVGGTIVDNSNPNAIPVTTTVNGTTTTSTADTSLSFPDLVLTNGSDTLTLASGVTTFTFAHTIDYGTDYNIIATPAPSTHKTCVVTNGSGSAGHVSDISATVTCSTTTHNLSGTITGLTASGLVLINGSVVTPVSPAAGATTFAFPAVPNGATYGVTVQTQPPPQNCTVTNGVGKMGDSDIVVAVVCTTP